MWFFTNCTFFQQQCCEIEIVKLIGQQALSVRRATRKDLWIFWCVQKTKWKFKAVPLEGTTSTHISPSLLWFVIHCFGTAPKHKTERGFSSILRATLLMRIKGRSRAWLAVLTVFGRFRLPKHLWRARLSPLGWGAGAKVQFGVDNVCDWGCFWAQEEHGFTTRNGKKEPQCARNYCANQHLNLARQKTFKIAWLSCIQNMNFYFFPLEIFVAVNDFLHRKLFLVASRHEHWLCDK